MNLPIGFDEPIVNDDSSVEYDWMFDKNAFSLTIYPDGKLGYFYLIGNISGCGVSYLEDGNLPDFILNKIQELSTQSERIE
jgi:hypothetical protein